MSVTLIPGNSPKNSRKSCCPPDRTYLQTVSKELDLFNTKHLLKMNMLIFNVYLCLSHFIYFCIFILYVLCYTWYTGVIFFKDNVYIYQSKNSICRNKEQITKLFLLFKQTYFYFIFFKRWCEIFAVSFWISLAGD